MARLEQITPGAGGKSRAEVIELFLQELSNNGNVAASCRKAELTRDEVDGLRRADPDFEAAFQNALQDAYELLRAEARRRAVKGIVVPVISAGRPVVNVATGKVMQTRKYSDALLMMLIKDNQSTTPRRKAKATTSEEPMEARITNLTRLIAEDSDPGVYQPGGA